MSEFISDALFRAIKDNFEFSGEQNERVSVSIKKQETENVSLAQLLFENKDDTIEPFSQTPSFMHTHYFSKLQQFMEDQMLADFHKKFKLPKEEEWEIFLSTYLPKYKKDAQRDCQALFKDELASP